MSHPRQGVRRALVTGAAGFIGSRLSELLLAEGWKVTGLDCFTSYYGREVKEANLQGLRGTADFSFVEGDLVDLDLSDLLQGVDVVFHQAAQAGVRASWGAGFESYVHNNLVATQKLLEAAHHSRVDRFIYASSSSVYGNAARYPTRESDVCRPFSPYGVTKLAAENLVTAYDHNFSLSTVSLRYHTVYGPRQRPDMAIHRLIRASLTGEPFPLFAAGDFVRDFTFVDDICRANILSASEPVPPALVVNLAGGESVTMQQLIERVGQIVGQPVPIDERPGQAGDVRRTDADWSVARNLLGWSPQVTLNDGLLAQVGWHQSVLDN